MRAVTLPDGAEITPSAGSPAGGTVKAQAIASSSREEKNTGDDDDDDDSEDETKRGREEKESGGRAGSGSKGRVIFIDWYDGAEGLLHPQVPTLCIALDGGFVQLSRGVDDDAAPLVMNAHMTIRQVRRRRVRTPDVVDVENER